MHTRAVASPSFVRRCAAAAAAAAALGCVLAGPADAGQTTERAAEAVCASAPAGHAICDAEVAVNPRTGALVRPHVAVDRGWRSAAVRHAARPADLSGQAAPQSGDPAQLLQAYDLTWLAANRGAGDTIAIIDAYGDPTAESDLATFRSTYGLPDCGRAGGCLSIVDETGQTTPLPPTNAAWETETSLDLDAASTVCPNCHILLVEASDTDSDDMQVAMLTAALLGADQISASWSVPASTPIFPANILQDLGDARTPAIIAATGDFGLPAAGQNAFPAALPTVTAVGGTDLEPSTSATNPRGYTETAWSNATAGCDTSEAALPYAPALGCAGRAYADVSADADPSTGLDVYSSSDGGWTQEGGTSLATPMVAAFEAVTGVDGTTPQWAYADRSMLNAAGSASAWACAGALAAICNTATGYDGPTGAGSISGQVVAGGPGVAAPPLADRGDGGTNTYVVGTSSSTALLTGGIYPNGLSTAYDWQYGQSVSYGEQTAPRSAGAGTGITSVRTGLTNLKPSTTYHYRLVATNADGVAYGYDDTLTTAAQPAAAAAAAARHAPHRATHAKKTRKHPKKKHAKKKHRPKKHRTHAKKTAKKRHAAARRRS